MTEHEKEMVLLGVPSRRPAPEERDAEERQMQQILHASAKYLREMREHRMAL